MNLYDLMDNYMPLYPSSHVWADTFAALSGNKYDKEIVDNLVEHLCRDGKFREPVTLTTVEQDGDDDSPAVKNGTHRVYAHYLAGVDEVFVQHGWPDMDKYEDAAPDTVDSNVTYVGFPHPVNEDAVDILFDGLRSFKLNENSWFETDSLAGHNRQTLSVMWVNPNGKTLPPHDFSEEEKALARRLKDLGFPDFVMMTRYCRTEYDLSVLEKDFMVLAGWW